MASMPTERPWNTCILHKKFKIWHYSIRTYMRVRITSIMIHAALLQKSTGEKRSEKHSEKHCICK